VTERAELPLLLSPWVKPHSPGGLARELQKEVGSLHPLYLKPAEAIAVARDRDDVLFVVPDDKGVRYAVVHLTWSRRTEENPAVPRTQFFDSLTAWIEWMKADHDDYTCGENDQKA
jgi:hypothetical protein